VVTRGEKKETLCRQLVASRCAQPKTLSHWPHVCWPIELVLTPLVAANSHCLVAIHQSKQYNLPFSRNLSTRENDPIGDCWTGARMGLYRTTRRTSKGLFLSKGKRLKNHSITASPINSLEYYNVQLNPHSQG
jgi:hypothetical protein